MAKGTSFDEVGEAVAAVKVMQGQIVALLEAVRLITARIEAIEKRPAAGGIGG